MIIIIIVVFVWYSNYIMMLANLKGEGGRVCPCDWSK